MVDTDETISPASIPIFNPTWTDYRSSDKTVLKNAGKTIRFEASSTFRFERINEEFDNGSYQIDLRIHYTNSNYHWVCLGVACESEFKGNKGLYYFQDSVMYSSYYPKVTKDHTDLNHEKFSVENKDTVSIVFDMDRSTIQFIHKEKQYQEVNLTNLPKDKFWYFVVGMFEGEVEIIN